MPIGKLRSKQVKNGWYRILTFTDNSGKRREKSLGSVTEEEALRMKEQGPVEVGFGWGENGSVILKGNQEREYEVPSLQWLELKEEGASANDFYLAQKKAFALLEQAIQGIENHPECPVAVGEAIPETRRVLASCANAFSAWFKVGEESDLSCSSV